MKNVNEKKRKISTMTSCNESIVKLYWMAMDNDFAFVLRGQTKQQCYLIIKK